ncbi:hypothetical protein [Elizabethkingia anophelis]|uniref:Uncharacterized protein n=1 Tax=Elizabethkingia anophelis TaxID=1117645 RepID=A0AAU8URT4_9FLAO|nr:hypothetical protein [Elizabethkingia anophelis]AQX00449.1 hypothetical protein BBD32_02700 [Elizabethkingia anophelis]OPB66217.1 hypothetical protein BAY11_14730 [Elizabethkingia anophelis]
MKQIQEFKSEKDYLEYLRCYYSGIALQGLLAGNLAKKSTVELMAVEAVNYADELIKQLKLQLSGEMVDEKVDDDSFKHFRNKHFTKSKYVKLVMKK